MSPPILAKGVNQMFQTPDITPAQLLAVVGAAIGVLVAAGLPLSQGLQDSIIQLVTVLAPILLVSDAVVRHGRAKGNADKSVLPSVE